MACWGTIKGDWSSLFTSAGSLARATFGCARRNYLFVLEQYMTWDQESESESQQNPGRQPKYSDAPRSNPHNLQNDPQKMYEHNHFESQCCYIFWQVSGLSSVDQTTMLQFEGSTQSRSWVFNTETLRECRRRAACTGDIPKGKLARKFASGFHLKSASSSQTPPATVCSQAPRTSLSSRDQESLARFHAYQLQTLVGPTAILTDLRRSDVALATATTLFRRFYLSNSVAEFSPRKMAAACSFFACKLEEERVEVSTMFPIRLAFTFSAKKLGDDGCGQGSFGKCFVRRITRPLTITMHLFLSRSRCFLMQPHWLRKD